MNNEDLVNDIQAYDHDPLRYAVYNFPWGEGELESSSTPRKWQAEILDEIKLQLSTSKVCRIAVASGHGVGKTAVTAMIQKWAMDTAVGTKCLVTANTGSQLKTKTWSELSKWHRMSLTNSWFDVTATSMFSTQEKYRLEWRSDIAIWREGRTEAFAGFHNYGKRILIIVDEASGIPKSIWETIESFFMDKDTEIICCVFGNPLRNSGGFYEIFKNEEVRQLNGQEPIWKCFNIDSRDVEGIDLKHIKNLAELYGEDSDYFRSRVRGLFPGQGEGQFFSNELVFNARKAIANPDPHGPLICGLDLSMGGKDRCVFYFRRGYDGRSIPPIILPGAEVHNAMEFAAKAAEIFGKYRPTNIFADKGGLGAPILDIIRSLGYEVFGVNFGGEATDKARYFNKTAEMADKCKRWLIEGGVVTDSPQLQEELTERDFGVTIKGQLRMESKDEMKHRGLNSPDIADALFLTFAFPVNVATLATTGYRKMKTTLDEYEFLKGTR
ncbi:MAG: terminase [Rhabdochlamydiaceae bacterium]